MTRRSARNRQQRAGPIYPEAYNCAFTAALREETPLRAPHLAGRPRVAEEVRHAVGSHGHARDLAGEKPSQPFAALFRFLTRLIRSNANI